MTEIRTISSLVDYMSWVGEMDQQAKNEGNDTLFYRGHSDSSYTLAPTVYRTNSTGASFRAVEHQLYEDMLRRDPTAFSSDKSVFEKVVRMQHYGLPTRLLDLTYSPLVALYFACEKNSNATGEVLLFPRENANVWFPSEVPDTALAGIQRSCSFEKVATEGIRLLQNFLRNQRLHTTKHAEFNAASQILLETCTENLSKAQQHKDLLIHVALLNQVEVELAAFVTNWEKAFAEQPEGSLTEQRDISDANVMLLRFDKRLADHKKTIIETLSEALLINHSGEKNELSKFLQQFTFFHFVHPPINSERIRRQQGAFVIYPPGKTEYWKLESQINPHRIQIEAGAKAKIIQELSGLGMNRSYIFPELSELAADVKLRYPATND